MINRYVGAGLVLLGACVVESSRTFLFNHWILSLVIGVVCLLLFPQYDEWKGGITNVLNHDDASMKKDKVGNAATEYESFFGSDSRKGGAEHNQLMSKRLNLYTQMVNHFYDLVTDFYEYGWGESFHFAPRARCESFADSLRRHEYYLALRLGLNSKTLCADLGCGVGGPLRSIARFSGSRIVGINNNEYQIKVASKHNERDRLNNICSLQKADFMKLPFNNEHFDAAYAIESTCHAPDKVACYSEIRRILKPGCLFAGYEWVMTDKYDPNNKRHKALKEGIEVGNGLPDIATIPHVVDSLKKAGFEVIDYFDCATGAPHEAKQIPWYAPLQGAYSLTGFRMTQAGRTVTHALVNVLEAIKIAPKGSVKVSKLLNDTANDLVESGKIGIFSPNFFFLARRPV